MHCPESSRSLEFLVNFTNKASSLRIPISGSIDLTHRCNLRCIHCYAGPQEFSGNAQKQELDTKRILHLVDELTEAGCIYLLISGGEPLLRNDFETIYRHAKKNGMLMTIFSNGTLISKSILELFEELPPQEIEVSLYGASAETHELITRVQGSYGKCLDGVQQLLKYGVRVNLKTILMTLNKHELSGMEDISRNLGIKFRFDAAIFPRLNGDGSPMKLRIPPEEAVLLELSSDDIIQKYREYHQKHRQASVMDTIYVCGAGITNFHIDPYGNLQPCLMSSDIRHNIKSGDFLKGWKDTIPLIMEKKVNNTYNCNRCDMRSLCGYCPAFFRLETGSEYIQSHYLCSMGKYRYQMIKQYGGTT